MITYFKNKNIKSEKKYKNYKTLNTVLESMVSLKINRASSTSLSLASTGVGLIIRPKSAGIACT